MRSVNNTNTQDFDGVPKAKGWADTDGQYKTLTLHDEMDGGAGKEEFKDAHRRKEEKKLKKMNEQGEKQSEKLRVRS